MAATTKHHWCLELGVYLELGAWSLELGAGCWVLGVSCFTSSPAVFTRDAMALRQAGRLTPPVFGSAIARPG